MSAIDQLRQTCRTLLAEGRVQLVIGYGAAADDDRAHPVFITTPDQCEQFVWDERCTANLVAYLKRKEIRSRGRVAIVVKGCDARALVVLAQENQIDRAQIVAIGMACRSVGKPSMAKCGACDVHMPREVDMVIGEVENRPVAPDEVFKDVATLLAEPDAERAALWREELSRCVKCYACRQVCPMCYCERCIADKNRPTCIDTSATPKGNFAWHITRAFHLAGRCVGCDACTEACPAGIDLRLLNLALARACHEQFGFRAGMDPKAEPILGNYSTGDRETFIQ